MCVYPSVHFRYENENHQNGSESTEFLGQKRKQVMGGLSDSSARYYEIIYMHVNEWCLTREVNSLRGTGT